MEKEVIEQWQPGGRCRLATLVSAAFDPISPHARSVYFMYFGLPLELGWIIKIHGSCIHRRLLKHTSNYKTLKAVFSSVNRGTLFFDPRLAYLTWLRVQRPRSEFFLLVEWQKATSFHLWKMPTPNSIVPNFTYSCWSIVQKLWEQNARRVKNPEKENQSRTTVDKCKSHVNCGYRLVFLFIFYFFIISIFISNLFSREYYANPLFIKIANMIKLFL